MDVLQELDTSPPLSLAANFFPVATSCVGATNPHSEKLVASIIGRIHILLNLWLRRSKINIEEYDPTTNTATTNLFNRMIFSIPQSFLGLHEFCCLYDVMMMGTLLKSTTKELNPQKFQL